MYLIWSIVHRAWWRTEKAGYTEDLNQAGRYTKEEAGDIHCSSGIPGEQIAVYDNENVLKRWLEKCGGKK